MRHSLTQHVTTMSSDSINQSLTPAVKWSSSIKNLSGMKFGRLSVIRYAGNTFWECKCDCGATKNVRGRHLRIGHTKSCGCLHRQVIRTHGLSTTLEYWRWVAMMRRCFDEKNNAYPEYGAKGITVCERWRKMENFFADMGPMPSKDHQVDRWPNQKGNYEPGNCRWATRVEQANNVSSNVIWDVDGVKMTIAEWARKSGIPYATLRQRVKYYGWPIEKALTHPVMPRFVSSHDWSSRLKKSRDP